MQRILFIEIIFTLIISIKTQDFGFFYDNSKDNIYISSENNNTAQSYQASTLLNSNSLKRNYYSSAGINKFHIEYHSCNIPSILDMSLDLIKVEYNLIEYQNTLIKEIILDLSNTNEKIFPSKYKDEFIIEQNKQASNKGSQNRDTIIYDTFGFNIRSKHNLNFKVSKVLLVNYRKKKLNYLANLSYNIRQNFANNLFDIYLRNMPEDFELFINLDLYDENGNETGEKILIVTKEFNYPNYKVEEQNPNNTMFIISITFIIIAFILIIIFGFF